MSSATAVLDSEALSCLANPQERLAAARRSQAVLESIERRGGYAVVPAPVLAEVARGRRRAAVDHWVNRLDVVATDRDVATDAADLLDHAQMDSSSAVDAFVVSTAAAFAPAIVLTADPSDMAALAANLPGVAVQQLP